MVPTQKLGHFGAFWTSHTALLKTDGFKPDGVQ
jgi:hypothetical protein